MIPAKNRYDRQGNPLTDYRDIENKLIDNDYKIVKQERVQVEGSEYLISTVWLGLNQLGGTDDKPLIFETMIFIKQGPDFLSLDSWMQRYSTEQETLDGHKYALKYMANIYMEKMSIKED